MKINSSILLIKMTIRKIIYIYNDVLMKGGESMDVQLLNYVMHIEDFMQKFCNFLKATVKN